MRFILKPLIVVTTVFLSSAATSAPITFGFQGQTRDILGLLPEELPFSGSFTFDPATMSSFVVPDVISTNVVYEPISSFSLQIGSNSFVADPSYAGSLNVEDRPHVGDDVGDAFRINLLLAPGQTLGGVSFRQLRFVVFLHTSFFSSAALPTDTSFFDENRGISVQFNNDAFQLIELGQMDNMFTIVPSPGAIGLLGFGLLGLVSRRKK